MDFGFTSYDYDVLEPIELYSIEHVKNERKIFQSNCKNCGAPLKKNDCCDYCRSDFRVIETPKLNNFKNGGIVETKEGGWSDLNSYQKVAVILFVALAPIQLFRFHKK